ncbi:MAG: 30S ribosomal protein S1, partial [bacterium]
GGLSVDVGIPAFLPGSQIDIQRVTDFDQFVGQEVVCKILKVNKKRGNVIISRRKYIEEQRCVDKKKALETIQENQVLQGVVKNITSYGVFVDVGGIDGLLHITDMSWGRIAHPSELVKIGDTITVKVISFDKMHEKISLGMKQLAPNPWEHVDTKYPIGSKVKGRISSITDYGLFVEVEKGVEGLVHISEISWTERINNLSKYFSVGDNIEAVIVSLDKDNRRMSLSVKQLREDPWKMVAEKFKIGDHITGKISNITDFGLFVQLLEGVDGLVHISDISWTDHVTHPSERYKKGDDVSAVILSIDPDHRKVSLGIKQLEKDPWEKVAEQYTVGTTIEGTISKITNFGAFVKLPTGIEGLVHISELSDKEVEKVEDILQVGQTKTFRIIKVSPTERKLGLSLKTESKETSIKKDDTTTKEKTVKAQPKVTPTKQFNTEVHSAPKQAKEPIKGSLQQALEEHMKKQDTSETEESE